MIHYLLKRTVLGIISLLGVMTIVFVISHVIPGDPAILIAGRVANPEVIQHIRKELGLDKPLYEQYAIYLRQIVFEHNLGKSIITNNPVVKDLQRYFPATFELVTISMILTLFIGVISGIISAVNKDTFFDNLVRIIALSGVSMPIFWLAIILQLTFSNSLGILPTEGRITSNIILDHPLNTITGSYIVDTLLNRNWIVLKDTLLHLILPVVTLTYCSLARITRITRTSMLEVLNKDYMRTAKATGLSYSRVIFKHGFRNAVLPIMTMGGMVYGYLLGGSVLVEVIFSWPGMGRYVVDAIFQQDFPAIMGIVIFTGSIVIFLNLLVDISYAFLDPRIKYD